MSSEYVHVRVTASSLVGRVAVYVVGGLLYPFGLLVLAWDRAPWWDDRVQRAVVLIPLMLAAVVMIAVFRLQRVLHLVEGRRQ